MTWRVYIVDDNATVRNAYALFLSTCASFEVCGQAGTARQALDELPELQPDLLLVDIALPGMSGLELTAVLRERGCEVPVVVISAHDGPAYQRKAATSGANAFVTKYAAPALLEETITNTLTRPAA